MTSKPIGQIEKHLDNEPGEVMIQLTIGCITAQPCNHGIPVKMRLHEGRCELEYGSFIRAEHTGLEHRQVPASSTAMGTPDHFRPVLGDLALGTPDLENSAFQSESQFAMLVRRFCLGRALSIGRRQYCHLTLHISIGSMLNAHPPCDQTPQAEADLAPVVTIVMPCLDEAETLGASIAQAQRALTQLGVIGEVIVADNGSTDGSVEIARNACVRIVPVAERGYGMALLAGLSAARAPYVVYADCDGSYDFGECGRLLAKLREGADLVLGSRFPSSGGHIHAGAMPWLHRFVGTPILTAICRLLYGAPITDINSGMRGLRLSAFRSLRIMATGMEFASEIILQMARRGFRIAEVPITLHKDGRTRPPHLRTWRDGWRHLCILLIYSPAALFLVPGAALALSGGAALAMLTPGPVILDHVSFSTNSRIVASLVTLAGTQIFLMGILAKYMAHTQQLFETDHAFVSGVQRFSRRYAIPLGLFFLVVGIVAVAFAFRTWSQFGFGAFAFVQADRMLAPAATLTVLGLQLIASAFFTMLLDMVRHR